jgi:NAD(P)-dependent dehydrogenase (short-subunit alcohol dehydrogenase family)
MHLATPRPPSYRVVGLDNRPPEAGTLWLDGSPSADLLQLDLADESQIDALPTQLLSRLGVATCHCLVNNAGIAGAPRLIRRDC